MEALLNEVAPMFPYLLPQNQTASNGHQMTLPEKILIFLKYSGGNERYMDTEVKNKLTLHHHLEPWTKPKKLTKRSEAIL